MAHTKYESHCAHCNEARRSLWPKTTPVTDGSFVICLECRKPSRVALRDGETTVQPSTTAEYLAAQLGHPPTIDEITWHDYRIAQQALLRLIGEKCLHEKTTTAAVPVIAMPVLTAPIHMELIRAIPAAAKNSFTHSLLSDCCDAVPEATFMMIYELLDHLGRFARVERAGSFDLTQCREVSAPV